MAKKTKVEFEAVATDTTGETFRTVQRHLQNTASATAILDGPLSAISGRISAVAAAFGRASPGVVGFAAAAGGLLYMLKTSISEFTEYETRVLTLEGLLRATGYAAGFSSKELQQMAYQVDATTLASEKDVLSAISTLATFSNVRDDVFKRAIEQSQNFAAVFGDNITTAAQKLGRALDNPSEGLQTLQRRMTNITDADVEMAKQMQQSGRLIEAQELILARLDERIGGSGAAQAGGLAGKVDSLALAWNRLKLEIGESGPVQGVAASLIDTLTATVQNAEGIVKSSKLALAPDSAKSVLEKYQELFYKIETLEKLRDKPKTGLLEMFGYSDDSLNEKISAVAEKIALLSGELEELNKKEESRRAISKKTRDELDARAKAEQDAIIRKQEMAKWEREMATAASRADAIWLQSLDSRERVIAQFEIQREEIVKAISGGWSNDDSDKIIKLLDDLIKRRDEALDKLDNKGVDKRNAKIDSGIESVRQSLLSEEQQLEDSYNRRSLLLIDAITSERGNKEEHYQMLLLLEKEYLDKSAALNREAMFSKIQVTTDYLQNFSSYLNQYTSAMLTEKSNYLSKTIDEINDRETALEQLEKQIQKYNRADDKEKADRLRSDISRLKAQEAIQEKSARHQFEVNKWAQRGNVVVNTSAAIMNAYATPGVHPLAATGMAIMIAAAGAAQLRAIDSASFNGGGGISTPSGANNFGANDLSSTQGPQRVLQVQVIGNVYGMDDFKQTVSDILRDEFDADVVLINSNSAQAQALKA